MWWDILCTFAFRFRSDITCSFPQAKVQSEDAPLAGSRAQAILKPILLRRTKNSTLEGKPLLVLPEKHIEIVKLKFTAEEREVSSLHLARQWTHVCL